MFLAFVDCSCKVCKVCKGWSKATEVQARKSPRRVRVNHMKRKTRGIGERGEEEGEDEEDEEREAEEDEKMT